MADCAAVLSRFRRSHNQPFVAFSTFLWLLLQLTNLLLFAEVLAASCIQLLCAVPPCMAQGWD